jgi:hypothetical protein
MVTNRHSLFCVCHCSRMTILQQTPIKGNGEIVDIGLGSKYAFKLGLGNIGDYEPNVTGQETCEGEDFTTTADGDKSGGKKKKKSKKKKK